MFSVSTIYSAKDFLSLVQHNDLTTNQFLESFKRYRHESAEIILKLVTECGWIHLNSNGRIILSEKGFNIAQKNYKSALQVQLEQMINIYKPDWASVIPRGRNEAIRFLPANPKQCFKEAGLMDDMSDELIKIWDRLSLSSRNYTNHQLLEIGREGEKLSVQYERQRTGKKPFWQAIESNLVGYDLLSCVDSDNETPLLIEVKSSTSKLKHALFYLTKNEWRVAKRSENYIFHLWILGSDIQHFIVPFKKIEKHVPSNNGGGEWESVRIPFQSVI
ncbi:DUF3883 domain-containing protein [Robertkochia aurantiaca]|uniref:DUF3883 domain-containing protein n=1 Tax=Robertkochia aurantiaca TaxID=2873700 RepID=UPI001CC9B991|nr:DUF3883 domain-containing protein [Robertkochia sp. 3YJGBD-33]